MIKSLRSNQSADDLKNLILSQKEKKPDLILFTTQSKQSLDIIDSLKQSGSQAFFLGTDAWVSVDFIKMIQSLGLKNNLAFPGHWPPSPENKFWNRLRDRIKLKFSVVLSPLLSDPILTYDAGHLIIAALKKWNGKSSDDLAEIIRKVSFDGILGSRKLLPTGESNLKVYLFELKNGEIKSQES